MRCGIYIWDVVYTYEMWYINQSFKQITCSKYASNLKNYYNPEEPKHLRYTSIIIWIFFFSFLNSYNWYYNWNVWITWPELPPMAVHISGQDDSLCMYLLSDICSNFIHHISHINPFWRLPKLYLVRPENHLKLGPDLSSSHCRQSFKLPSGFKYQSK